MILYIDDVNNPWFIHNFDAENFNENRNHFLESYFEKLIII